MAHGQDHHPELAVHFNHCTVRWHTHSVDGLSENDFVCAARTDALADDLADDLAADLASDRAIG
jgi:4a-hydroxytetrahydrobiopterin dehydratase